MLPGARTGAGTAESEQLPAEGRQAGEAGGPGENSGSGAHPPN